MIHASFIGAKSVLMSLTQTCATPLSARSGARACLQHGAHHAGEDARLVGAGLPEQRVGLLQDALRLLLGVPPGVVCEPDEVHDAVVLDDVGVPWALGPEALDDSHRRGCSACAPRVRTR